ncbi:MAG: valine--tRNA ligase [Oscillospiraceae bacterium]|jgi:valyl-tRNA synthetase|nr:valine--tRNA ligase [Oscillospiraceae bacterium]
MKKLDKTYSPKDFEERIYKNWEENGYFRADAKSDKPPYTIVIPPPNVTGILHMGHALNNTYQDILCRWKRMSGYEVLWLPGTDHASISTEARVVASLKKQGVSKKDLGRENFLKEAWKWTEKYGGAIINQLKKLGSSCDWERERFTMDEGCSAAVQKVFLKLYADGKTYRGLRIVNWCPECKTSISDDECDHEEKAGHFWHIKYPFADGSGHIQIATTRPETMLGDTAVAVNPDDERYKDLIGKMVILPLMEREIPIIADEYVEKDFGTGMVKITPAHDPNDFEVGTRHNLPVINVMDERAVINANGGKYKNLNRYEARKAIVKDLEELGLLVKTEEHTHNVGTCGRCGTVIEPWASVQWFVKMKELAQPALEAVKSGKIKMIPKHFENNYFAWMENVRDWCISRQLWWGHRIPAYYCKNIDCKHMEVSENEVQTCAKCNSEMKQDEDTFDTWFSSALWPFSTLGWGSSEEETEDFRRFFPTQTLVTAADIIFLWIARMIFSSLEYTGKIPFDTVMFNGLVLDAQGRKMSKSLDNGVDPLEMIDKYGADALRFMLICGNATGNNMRWNEEKIAASRNFANKLWNAARYVLMNLPESFEETEIDIEKLTIEDKWILTLYNKLVKDVTHNLEQFELGVAAGNIQDFIWNIYCDWYIELTKPRLAAGGENALVAQNILVLVMRGMLKLLHPFMPFITEEIWSAIPQTYDSIMILPWEKYNEKLNFKKESEDFGKVINAISAIRAKRAELNVPPSKKIAYEIETKNDNFELFKNSTAFFEKLASASEISLAESVDSADGKAVIVTDSARIFIPMGELVDTEKERGRLTKEMAAVQSDIDFVKKQLDNEKFIAKAPPEQVEKAREKLCKAEEKMQKIKTSLEAM